MTTTIVKTYRSAHRFRKDAPRMARKGYQVVSSFQEPSKNKPLRNLLKVFVGGTLLWGSSIKGGKIVVTYQALGAVVVAQPVGLSGAGGGLQAITVPPGSRAVAPPQRKSANLLATAMIAVLLVAVLIVAVHAL